MMMDNIYRLLNDTKTDLEEYEHEEMSELEKRRIKNMVIRRSRNKYTRIAAASVCALVIGLGFGYREDVYAVVRNLGYTLSTFMNAENIENYVNVINSSVTDEGYTVTLNEVVMDRDEIMITKTITSDKPIEAEMFNASSAIFINGKMPDGGASGGGKRIDDRTFQDIMYYSLSGAQIDPAAEVRVDCQLREIRLASMDSEQTISGKWDFSFKASGAELITDTESVIMNDTITMPDGTKINLTEYSSNAFGQKIYFDILEGRTMAYQVEFRGFDEQNNPVVFYISSIYEGKGVFKVETIDNGYISENAKKLTLDVYAAEKPKGSGRMSNDYKKLESLVAIDLN